MKVLYIISTLRRCGPTNLLYDVIFHLPCNQFDVTILTLSPERGISSRWDDFLAIEGVKVLSLNNSSNNIKALGKQVKNICKELQPNVVHSQGFRPDVIAALFLKNYKCVYNIQNYPYDDYVMQFGTKGYLMAFLNIFLLRKSKYVTVCSKYVKSKIEKSFKYKLHVVENAVEEGYVKVDSTSLASLQQSMNINSEDKVFVFAGNLIKRKNPLVLIEAFNILYEKSKNFKLLVLGDGYLMQECVRQKKYDNIILQGNVEDVSKYYQISHYYLTASLSEGMPVSVLEALNHGLPIILSNIPQHAEVVECVNSAGILFEKNSAEDLANKIVQFTKLPYQSQSYDASNSITHFFNGKRMSQQFQNLYLLSL